MVKTEPWNSGQAALGACSAAVFLCPRCLQASSPRVPRQSCASTGMLEQQRTPTQGKRAWLHLRKLGQCWEETPALEGRTRRPWDVDQEAVVPPAPPPSAPPPMSGLPGTEPDLSFVLGPGYWRNALQSGSRGGGCRAGAVAKSSSWLLLRPRVGCGPSSSANAIMVLHALCTLSSLGTFPARRRAGGQAAGRP